MKARFHLKRNSGNYVCNECWCTNMFFKGLVGEIPRAIVRTTWNFWISELKVLKFDYRGKPWLQPMLSLWTPDLKRRYNLFLWVPNLLRTWLKLLYPEQENITTLCLLKIRHFRPRNSAKSVRALHFMWQIRCFILRYM